MSSPEPVETAPVEDSSPAVETTSIEDSQPNPAWGEAYSSMPEHLQPLVEPYYRQWDKQVSERYADYDKYKTGYEGYQALGTPENLQGYVNVINNLNQNPVEFYGQLTAELQRRGLLQQEADPNSGPLTDNETDVDEENDPRYTQLQQQLDQVRGFLEQQNTQKEVQTHTDRINGEMAQLQAAHVEKYGESVPFNAPFILKTAIVQQQQGRKVDLTEGYNEYVSIWEQANAQAAKAPQKPTPFVVNPSGGSVPQEVVPKNESDIERRNRAQAFIESMTQNG